MRRGILYVLFAGMFLVTQSNAFCEVLEPEHETTKKLIDLVNEAAALIEKKGEVALVEFQREGSKWRHGETYIFVLDMDGNCLVHPDSELVGKNLINLRDANGKMLARSFILKASGEDKVGWTHYMWPKPKSIFPVWKSTYVKKAVEPSGQEYIVCCGLYNMKMEKMFVVEVVNEAVELIQDQGKGAFSAFMSKSGDFYFLNTYVFVLDDRGNDLVNPPFPNLEGRNMYDFRDQEGKYLIRDMIKIVQYNGSGWTEFMWARPGESAPVRKQVFVKGTKVGNQLLIVGSGLYSD